MRTNEEIQAEIERLGAIVESEKQSTDRRVQAHAELLTLWWAVGSGGDAVVEPTARPDALTAKDLRLVEGDEPGARAELDRLRDGLRKALALERAFGDQAMVDLVRMMYVKQQELCSERERTTGVLGLAGVAQGGLPDIIRERLADSLAAASKRSCAQVALDALRRGVSDVLDLGSTVEPDERLIQGVTAIAEALETVRGQCEVLEATQRDHDRARDSLRGHIRKLEGDLEHARCAARKQETRAQVAEAALGNLQRELDAARAGVKALHKELEDTKKLDALRERAKPLLNSLRERSAPSGQEGALTESQRELSEALADKRIAQARVVELEKALAEARADEKTARAGWDEAVQQMVDACKDKDLGVELDAEVLVLGERIAFVRRQAIQAREGWLNALAQRDSLRRRIASLEAERATLAKSPTERYDEAMTAQRHLEAARRDAECLRRDLEAQRQHGERLAGKVYEAVTRAQVAEAANGGFRLEMDDLKKRHASELTECRTHDDRWSAALLEAARDEREAALVERDALRDIAESYREEVGQLRFQLAELSRRVRVLESRDRIRTKIASFRERRDEARKRMEAEAKDGAPARPCNCDVWKPFDDSGGALGASVGSKSGDVKLAPPCESCVHGDASAHDVRDDGGAP